MANNKKRPSRADLSRRSIRWLIAVAFVVAGVGLYAFYYQHTQAYVPPSVTLPR
jgi:disulfide bond formation protein DsbB